MADYEATAYLSLEKLKERHMEEYTEFQEWIWAELKLKLKYSKDLVELRYKQEKLVKLRKYKQADTVKAKADILEQIENEEIEKKMSRMINKKEKRLWDSQERSLQALLSRI